jgi:hypothetical protein
MVDRNLQNFYGRLGRIENIHRAGGGFEADGTLGMSFYNSRRRQGRRIGILAPLALVAMSVLGLKAAVHATIGAELYEARVAELTAAGGVQQAGAYVLQADPLTLAISDKIGSLID